MSNSMFYQVNSSVLSKQSSADQQAALTEAVLADLLKKKVQEQAAKQVMTTAGLGAGAGLLMAGLYNASQLNRQQVVSRLPKFRSMEIGLFDAEEKKRKKKKVDPALFSYSAVQPSITINNQGAAPAKKPLTIKTADFITDLVFRPSETINKGMSGSYATKPSHLPWYPAAIGGAAVASGLGSYYAANKLFQKMRSKAMARQLANAEKEYEQALYDASAHGPGKMAGERCKLAQAMDYLVDTLRTQNVKLSTEGNIDPSSAQTAGNMAGLYLALAAGLGGLGAYQGYKAQRRNSKSKAVQMAQLERLEAWRRDQPVDIIALVDKTPGA